MHICHVSYTRRLIRLVWKRAAHSPYQFTITQVRAPVKDSASPRGQRSALTWVELSSPSPLALQFYSPSPPLFYSRVHAHTRTHTHSLTPVYLPLTLVLALALSSGFVWRLPPALSAPPQGVLVPSPGRAGGRRGATGPGVEVCGQTASKAGCGGWGMGDGATPKRTAPDRVPAEKTVSDCERQRRGSCPLQRARVPPCPPRRGSPAAARANKGRRARGAPPSGGSSLGGPRAAFQGFLRLPGMHSPPSRPDVCPALRFLALALLDGAHFDVLVT